MERFFQYFFDGLSVGAIYTLLALGLVVVFRGTGHLNFAQGEMAMFCTFLVWQIQDWGVPLWISVLLGMVLGFILGAITEVVLIRPIGQTVGRRRRSSSRSPCSSGSTRSRR